MLHDIISDVLVPAHAARRRLEALDELAGGVLRLGDLHCLGLFGRLVGNDEALLGLDGELEGDLRGRTTKLEGGGLRDE
jgi:hypothetical protein